MLFGDRVCGIYRFVDNLLLILFGKAKVVHNTTELFIDLFCFNFGLFKRTKTTSWIVGAAELAQAPDTPIEEVEIVMLLNDNFDHLKLAESVHCGIVQL